MLAGLGGTPVTLALVGVNLAVSLYAFSQFREGRATERFLFEPYEVRRGRNRLGLLLSEFSHADATHLIFNLITLYFFGPVIERALGPAQLLVCYVAAAVGSTLLTYGLHRHDPDYRALGASGAISGVLFGAIVLQPDMGVYLGLVPVAVPAPLYAVAYVALSIWGAHRRLGNVGHEAHLGGALAGFVVVARMSPWGLAPLVEATRDLLG